MNYDIRTDRPAFFGCGLLPRPHLALAVRPVADTQVPPSTLPCGICVAG